MAERRGSWPALVLSCLVLGYLILGATAALSSVLDPADATLRRTLPPCADPASACFDFEGEGVEGWESPDWFDDHDRLVACDLDVVRRPLGADGHALRLGFELPSLPWSATAIRFTGPVDLRAYHQLSVDVLLPREIPGCAVSARVILRAGDAWTWYEIKKRIRLEPGQWVTVTTPLVADAGDLDIWGESTASLLADMSTVQEIMIRVEFATAGQRGPDRSEILIDHVTLTP
ncbi:MAG: hypothetical protein GY838_17250 [bacterium]|nr:hypothetical protein [bacterium]